MSEPPMYARMYVFQGHVHHLVDVDHLGTTGSQSSCAALCCYAPSYPWHWQGTTGDEYQHAAGLRRCRYCARKLERLGGRVDAPE